MISKEIFNQFKDGSLTVPAIPEEFINIKFSESPNESDSSQVHPQSGAILPFKRSSLFESELIRGSKLTLDSEDIEDCKDIFDFWLQSPLPDFVPGDSIGIFPTNPSHVVDSLIASQKWAPVADKEIVISVNPSTKKKNAKVPDFIPKTSTIRTILTKCLDLRSAPKKLFLLACIKYCNNPEDQFIVSFLCSKEGMQVYTKEIVEKRISIVDFLLSLDINIPFNILLEHCPRLLPRPYSIANCNYTTNQFRIIFSFDKINPGLSTSFLKNLIEDIETNNKISFYFRAQNDFKLEPNYLEKNIIMIGPGVGASPFIGFLDQISKLVKGNNSEKRILFTSSRYQNGDNVFKKEFEQFLNNNSLSKLYQSFTRETNPKQYVQNLIYDNKTEFVDLILNENSVCFICGEGKIMIPQIENTIEKCLIEVKEMKQEEANALIKSLKSNKRIILDSWI